MWLWVVVIVQGYIGSCEMFVWEKIHHKENKKLSPQKIICKIYISIKIA